MTCAIRFLVVSAFLLFLPTGATPPAKHLLLGYLCPRTIPSKGVLSRPYLLSLRFRKSEETKVRVQICEITVIMLVKGVAPDATQQSTHSLNVLAIGSHKQCKSVQEVVDGRTSPVSPMF